MMLTHKNMDTGSWPRSHEPLGLDESIRIFDQMRRLFGEFDRSFALPSANRVRAIAPRVDLVDTGDELRLYAEVPGFREEDLEITVRGNVVALKGRRRTEIPEGHTVHRRERGDIGIARTMTLSSRIDPDRVEATLASGVLQLTMPKVPDERPRQIPVRAT